MEVKIAGSVVQPELNRAIGNFVSYRLFGAPGKIDRFSSLGVFHRGEIVAGLVYHNWHPEAAVIEISGAATDARWLTPRVLREMFRIPFGSFRCQMVVFRISPSNEHLLGIIRRFGFTEHRIPRLRGRDEDEIIATFTDDQWRAHPLLRERNGQKFTSRAA